MGHLCWACLLLPSEDITVEYIFYFDNPWTSSEIAMFIDTFKKSYFSKIPKWSHKHYIKNKNTPERVVLNKVSLRDVFTN